MPYKIQMIAPTSFFADTGCHVRILEEISTLQEAGHHVTVCTYHMGDPVPGVSIQRSLDVPWRKGVQVGSSRHKLYFDAMLALKSLQVAWQQQPDIIHAHLHEGALIGFPLKWLVRGGRAPLIFDFQGSLTSEMVDHKFLSKDGLLYKPTLLLEKLINRLPDKIVTSSYNAAHILQDQFNVPPQRITTISDRVNFQRFRPGLTAEEAAETARLKAELGIPADRKVVVYLGLLAQYQGTDMLLEAARLLQTEMPDAFFVVMGYPGVESYARQAEAMGLQDRVIFPGRIPYQDAPRYLRLGDVAVAPKMSATEGAGKITTYMAMGLPVVTFDTPVSREIMGHLGVYAQFGSARSLADKLKELLNDETRRLVLGRALRAKAVVELGGDSARQELEALYESVLATKPKKRLLPAPRLELGVAANSGPATADTRFAADSGSLSTRHFAADSGHEPSTDPADVEEREVASVSKSLLARLRRGNS